MHFSVQIAFLCSLVNIVTAETTLSFFDDFIGESVHPDQTKWEVSTPETVVNLTENHVSAGSAKVKDGLLHMTLDALDDPKKRGPSPPRASA